MSANRIGPYEHVLLKKSVPSSILLFYLKQLAQHENIFQDLFCSLGERGCWGFPFMHSRSAYRNASIAFSCLKGEHISLNRVPSSCCSQFQGSERSEFCLWSRSNALQWEATVLSHAWWLFFPWTVETCEEMRRLCVTEGKGGSDKRKKKKEGIIYYSNEMRSSRWWKRGRGLAAENLLLSTSVVSIRPWRNKKVQRESVIVTNLISIFPMNNIRGKGKG